MIATSFNSNEDGAQPVVPFQALSAACITIQFVLVYAMSEQAHAEAARDINAALHAGVLRPRVAQRPPLDQIADAH